MGSVRRYVFNISKGTLLIVSPLLPLLPSPLSILSSFPSSYSLVRLSYDATNRGVGMMKLE